MIDSTNTVNNVNDVELPIESNVRNTSEIRLSTSSTSTNNNNNNNKKRSQSVNVLQGSSIKSQQQQHAQHQQQCYEDGDKEFDYTYRYNQKVIDNTTTTHNRLRHGTSTGALPTQTQTSKISFPIRNSTAAHQQTQFHPTWDEWKRQHEKYLERKQQTSQQQQTDSSTITASESMANESQTNESNAKKDIYEEIHKHKYTNETRTIEHQEQQKQQEQQQKQSQQKQETIHHQYSNNDHQTHKLTKNEVQKTNYENKNTNNILDQIKTLDYYNINTDNNNKKEENIEDNSASNYYSYHKSSNKYHFENNNDKQESKPISNCDYVEYSKQIRKTKAKGGGEENNYNNNYNNNTKIESTSTKIFSNKQMQDYFDQIDAINRRENTAATNENMNYSRTNDGAKVSHMFNDSRTTGNVVATSASALNKKIKTITSTTKRKDSLPNLSGSRSRLTDLSDSDTEVQNRLLAKATGSIPIEYISIRRDPKPAEKQVEKAKKAVTTSTNTNVERGKRIASTNTDTEELPTYNLHLSLDSLIKRDNKREVSTSTDRIRCLRHTGTVTEKKQIKDAYTLTDDADTDSEVGKVTSHMEIPIQETHRYTSYRSRKERFEWETASSPGIRDEEDTYRLELLAKSPKTMRRKHYTHQSSQSHKYSAYNCEDDTDVSDLDHHNVRRIPITVKQHEVVRVDDDDKLIFGESYSQQRFHERRDYSSSSVKKRSGSYPAIFRIPIQDEATTRRYIKTSHNTNFWPPFPTPVATVDQYQMNIMPLKNGTISTDAWNAQFNEMHSKFNQVFGQQNSSFQTNSFTAIQPFIAYNLPVEPKTERYYKYSKTTTNGSQQMPTFGEIYKTNASYNSYSQSSKQQQRQQAQAQAHHHQQQQSQQFQSPIIEMPATPNSTIKSTRRTQSYGENANTYRSASASANGPIITPLSPTASDMNINNASQSYSTSNRQGGKQNYSSYHSSSSKQQYSGSRMSSSGAGAAAAAVQQTTTAASKTTIDGANEDLRKAQSCIELETPRNNSSSYSYVYSSSNNNNNNNNNNGYNGTIDNNVENRFIPIQTQTQQSSTFSSTNNRNQRQYGAASASSYEYKDEYRSYPTQQHQTLIANQI